MAEGQEDWFDDSIREASERGTLEVLTETELWQRLGLVEPGMRYIVSIRRPCWLICSACRWP